ncbi:MAG TPA: hypothetical protein VLA88_00650 [Candidatus Saccharimonadales bacterium]|nr:hypothetical protein [Candidatus Saccharimonadales bacterium]
MFAIPGPNAPKQTSRVIVAYGTRWGQISVPTVLIGLLTWLIWWARLASDNPVRDKTWITVGMAAFTLGWWGMVGVGPTLRYRKLKREGHILEFRNRDIAKFRKNFWKLLEARLDAIREAEAMRLNNSLAHLHGLVAGGDDGGLHTARAFIEAEEARLRALQSTNN